MWKTAEPPAVNDFSNPTSQKNLVNIKWTKVENKSTFHNGEKRVSGK